MPTAKVTSKGQITIPAQVRKALGLEEGSEVLFFEAEPGEWRFRPRTGSIWDLKGSVPKPAKPVSVEEMNQGMTAAAAASYARSVGGRVGRARRGAKVRAA